MILEDTLRQYEEDGPRELLCAARSNGQDAQKCLDDWAITTLLTVTRETKQLLSRAETLSSPDHQDAFRAQCFTTLSSTADMVTDIRKAWQSAVNEAGGLKRIPRYVKRMEKQYER